MLSVQVTYSISPLSKFRHKKGKLRFHTLEHGKKNTRRQQACTMYLKFTEPRNLLVAFGS